MAVAYLATLTNGQVTIREFAEFVPPSFTLMAEITPEEAVQNLLKRTRDRLRRATDVLNAHQREHRIILNHIKRKENAALLACTS